MTDLLAMVKITMKKIKQMDKMDKEKRDGAETSTWYDRRPREENKSEEPRRLCGWGNPKCSVIQFSGTKISTVIQRSHRLYERSDEEQWDAGHHEKERDNELASRPGLIGLKKGPSLVCL